MWLLRNDGNDRERKGQQYDLGEWSHLTKDRSKTHARKRQPGAQPHSGVRWRGSCEVDYRREIERCDLN